MKILNFLRKIWRKVRQFAPINTLGLRLYSFYFFRYDYNRFIKYAGLYPSSDIAVINRDIIFCIHCIEKGLTMPNFRYCFGASRIAKLSTAMQAYRKSNKELSFEYNYALSVLHEYLEVHKKANVTIPDDIRLNIEAAIGNNQIYSQPQPEFKSSSFWADREKPFPIFAASRHSVRDISGPANSDDIIAAIDVARSTPTACNRQFIKVHFIDDRDLTQEVLHYQHGSAGFGHNAHQLLLITGDLRAMAWPGERNEIYLNAGLFCMNLSYALHYHKVAHCILNWQAHPGENKKVCKILNINEAEEIAIAIMCGNPPQEFRTPASLRTPLENILTIHNKAN